MAWDTEGTRRRLMEAAVEEFSDRGFAGARVDRISAAAGVNKERIYQYFGGKDGLFGAVLAAELSAAMDAVPIDGEGVEAITDYAARLFDYQSAHPQLGRLTFWEGLERRVPVAEELRRAGAQSKIDRVRAALPELSETDVRELLLTILTLCDGFHALPNVDRLYGEAGEADADRLMRRRAAILGTVRAAAESLIASRREASG